MKKKTKSVDRDRPSPTGGAFIIPGYKQFGGKQSEAGALRNVLAHLGVVAPQTGEPFSEEMLFGIGGGIGLGYFVYASSDFTSLFIATRITTEESARPGFLQTICGRIGVSATVQHSSSAQAAEKNLKQALAQGGPPIVWVNPMALPYYGTPQAYHTLVVYGYDDEESKFYVADRCDQALVLTRSELAAARQSGGVPKLRALMVDAPPPAKALDLRKAVKEGLRDFCGQMQEGFSSANFRSNFGLKALEKWADLLTHPKDKRGWPKFFPSGPRLFEALLSAYDQIENRGSGGSAFRPMYADFLVEANHILGKRELNEVAEQFRESARLWSDLGKALLPDSVPLFKETRQLATRKRTLFEGNGAAAQAEMPAINRRLAEIKSQVEKAFPLKEDEVRDLLADLRARVLVIHAAEEKAVVVLQSLVH
ncbi:MAG: DUF4872 domain-containing protein [Chloroflexi bacterium]|nr:DUF4872 domain-containing protein [Chloroflexota bacterium]